MDARVKPEHDEGWKLDGRVDYLGVNVNHEQKMEVGFLSRTDKGVMLGVLIMLIRIAKA